MSDEGHKVALVTGASRGIGAAIAERLSRDGFTVAINFAGNTALAQALAQKISKDGGIAFPIHADVSDAVAVHGMFDTIEARFGIIDVLVNNAGIQNLATLADMTDAAFDRMIAINLKGVFNTLREAARRMRPGGRIINLSSGTTATLFPTYGPYAATKAAVEAMTAVLAREMRGRAVTVNSIAPGPTATDLYLKDKSPQMLAQAAMRSPLERLGQPADIAGAVSFLVGPDGEWVNGQTIRVNGGFS
ncbi:SDR family oxidoreductase [Paraburkholderia sp. XV]|uniref:SDR family oxidoreductase n=1 Tax=Paraburkholderia sp. XV TaxID=2831520 RepID=UPI001CD46DCA|nr:SDR family oxidoreductase [Paraburkholderia sp. XV]